MGLLIFAGVAVIALVFLLLIPVFAPMPPSADDGDMVVIRERLRPSRSQWRNS
jgi:hypothetical protein